jgi:SAM-dependent MidA family methyltransferase
MREVAARTAPEAIHLAPHELGTGHRGAILAVELFDALPVRRVRRAGNRLLEVGVGLDTDGALVERETPAPHDLVEEAIQAGVAREDGCDAEVCPAALGMLETMAAILDRGAIVIVDYGDRALGLARRPVGTLRSYRRHEVDRDVLAEPGERDLTAHVNFTRLEARARELGLAVLGSTTQDRFLVANGILEEFDTPDLAAARDVRRVKARLQAMQLIHPEGMGRAFRVLVLAKGRPPRTLQGLVDPFA